MLAILKTARAKTWSTTLATADQVIKRRMSQGFFTQVVGNIDDFVTEKPSSENQKSYENIIKKFEELSMQSLSGGGPRGIERHVKKNKKMLVRDRIKKIIDPGTEFLEIGSLAGFDMIYGDVPAAGLVAGIGRVCGTYCLIGGNDATVKGGTYFPITLKKSLRTQEIAENNRLPYIYIPDSGGAYLPLQSEIFLQGGRSFYNQAVMSSKGIYQIAVVCGSCTAGGAYNPTMSDEAIIVNNVGKIYLGGPPLVRAATGEIVSDEDLGGAFLHSSVSGCTDYFAQTEEDAFSMCRDIVESLNMKSAELLSDAKSYEEPTVSVFTDFTGREHFDKPEVYGILSSILDGSKFKEFKSCFGPGLIVGTGYIQGKMVGIVVNVNEIMSAEALKASHFMNMCDMRQIPLLFLQNSLPPSSSETDFDPDVLKNRGKMCAVVSTVQVPKIVVTISACHNDDALLMCGPSFNPSLNLSWVSSKFSHLSMEGSGRDSSNIYDAFDAAYNMLTDAVILPQSTRPIVGELLRVLTQQKTNPERTKLHTPVLRM